MRLTLGLNSAPFKALLAHKSVQQAHPKSTQLDRSVSTAADIKMDVWKMRQSSHATASFSGQHLHSTLPLATTAASRAFRGSHRMKQEPSSKFKLLARAAATSDVIDKKEQYNKSMGESVPMT